VLRDVPSGRQIISTLAKWGEPLPETTPPETAASMREALETGKPAISNVFFGARSGRSLITVGIPVARGGANAYYLLVAIPLDSFAAALGNAALPGQWTITLIDRNNTIIARSERHDDFVGTPLPAELLERSRAAKGVFRATNVAGAQIVRATVRSEVAGWLVSATVPVAFLEEPRRRSHLFAAAMLGTALALGLALAYIFGGFMTRPIADATTAAAAVGVGKLVEPIHSPLVEANALTAVLSGASSELKRREEHAAFLMRELAHRSKNQLAVVRGMALQTARQSKNIDQFTTDFNQRLQGLAQSQDLMLRQNWQGAWLEDLVRAHLDLFGAVPRMVISGPALFLNANAAQNIGFALHELATNATKHGALHAPAGRVAVAWQRTDDRIHLEWRESGGGERIRSDHRGFGSLVLTELVPQSLQGNATLEFLQTGALWTLDFPATHVLTSGLPSNDDAS